MTAPAPTFYVFHGDDDLRMDEELARLRARMGDGPNADLNISEFDGATADVHEILNAARSFPFLSDKRLVIARGLLAWAARKGSGATGKKIVEALLEALPALPDWTRLVLVERGILPEGNKVLQLAHKHERGKAVAFISPNDLTNWIERRAQDAYGASIERDAAAALASVVGKDVRRADNELVKLVSYVDGARPIREEDVALLTPYLAEAGVFEMVDALASGRGHDASVLLHRLLRQEDEDVFRIYGMIVRQFRLLLLIKEHLAAGGSMQSIPSSLPIKPYEAKKLQPMARGFTLADLERIYGTLHEYDVKMKTGRIEPVLALDLLIASLATR